MIREPGDRPARVAHAPDQGSPRRGQSQSDKRASDRSARPPAAAAFSHAASEETHVQISSVLRYGRTGHHARRRPGGDEHRGNRSGGRARVRGCGDRHAGRHAGAARPDRFVCDGGAGRRPQGSPDPAGLGRPSRRAGCRGEPRRSRGQPHPGSDARRGGQPHPGVHRRHQGQRSLSRRIRLQHADRRRRRAGGGRAGRAERALRLGRHRRRHQLHHVVGVGRARRPYTDRSRFVRDLPGQCEGGGRLWAFRLCLRRFLLRHRRLRGGAGRLAGHRLGDHDPDRQGRLPPHAQSHPARRRPLQPHLRRPERPGLRRDGKRRRQRRSL